MKVVIQRVSEASVEVEGKIVGRISKGLVILAGWVEDDDTEDLIWTASKIIKMRIFSDDEDKMNLSIKDIAGDVLLISQFTLHALTKKGNRPSFINAARPEKAKEFYEIFKKCLTDGLGKKIECGIFGADMKVKLINDGPVTIVMDSENKS